jgi:hypothetical protein
MFSRFVVFDDDLLDEIKRSSGRFVTRIVVVAIGVLILIHDAGGYVLVTGFGV